MFFFLVLLFFVIFFTLLGDLLIAPDRQMLLLSGANSQHRHQLVEAVESAVCGVKKCPVDTADYMCEDQRLDNQLSREMNCYKERHCCKLEDSPLHLILREIAEECGCNCGRLSLRSKTNLEAQRKEKNGFSNSSTS